MMKSFSDRRSRPKVVESPQPEVEQENTITTASIRNEMDGVHEYSEAQKEIQQLKNNNSLLKAEMNKLRATIIGSDFQAWDLGFVLKKFDNLRQQWLSLFLFDDDAKDGELLTRNMESVFIVTRNILDSHMKTIREYLFDFKESPTNFQFVTGVLQSNYTALEETLRKRMREIAHQDPVFLKFSASFLMKSNQREVAQKQFDGLFSDMIKISGMLFLCDRKLVFSRAYNPNDKETFEIVINSSEKLTVCFPGISSTDENGVVDWKSKVWIAIPPHSDRATYS
ncbi:hypothetical protein BC936DRAFT_141055 [Jimgerdemannia flammicorona]|uniref:Uncharacterized protein n=1 Tax=Jimgerdemannia flammicorona TaxID=994334 RepID=A0A433DGJ6_9FUNG|nr:hypothetical protein BC936DRAFT_141055 [Jimgerdemannia flammicorona]